MNKQFEQIEKRLSQIQQPSIYLILKNYKNDQQYEILIELQKQSKVQIQKQFLYNYFEKKVWIKGLINTQYQIQKRFEQQYCHSEYYIIRNSKNYQNYFVKRIRKNKQILSTYSSDSQKSKNRQRKGIQINTKTKYKILNIDEIIREINFQNMIKHQNIMRYINFMEDRNYFYLFFKQKPNKTLAKTILAQQNLIKSTKIKQIVRKIFKIMSLLYQNLIIHKNIRASSVFLIQSNDKWKICLGQFGYAQYIEQQLQSTKQNTFIETLHLIKLSNAQKIQNINFVASKSPLSKNKNNNKDKKQVPKSNIYSSKNNSFILGPQFTKGNDYYLFDISKNDIFSLGILFYQILFSKPFFCLSTLMSKYQNQVKMNKIAKRNKQITIKDLNDFIKLQSNQSKIIDFQSLEFRILSKSCSNLLKRMLQYHPVQRISIKQALQHEFFTSKARQNSECFFSNSSISLASTVFQSLLQQQYINKKQNLNQNIRTRYYQKSLIQPSSRQSNLKQQDILQGSKQQLKKLYCTQKLTTRQRYEYQVDLIHQQEPFQQNRNKSKNAYFNAYLQRKVSRDNQPLSIKQFIGSNLTFPSQQYELNSIQLQQQQEQNINFQQMDDSHINFKIKDIRIMKPSMILNKVSNEPKKGSSKA